MNNKRLKDEIKRIILSNSDDVEIMDYINSISFPFTSKYQSFIKQTPNLNKKLSKEVDDDNF